MTTRIVELRKGILKKNDELATELRAGFTKAGLLVLNLVSSPGTGKTAFLERTLRELRQRGIAVAALVGDLETDNDARRLASSGAPVRQINTHGICHLDAEMIGKNLEGLDLQNLSILFIENVGNLVCPSSYDLGEKIRVALLSVTEGEDKPLKYPTLFNSADVAVITKMDLAQACEFDRVAAVHNIREIRPGIKIFETSARTGDGMAEWLDYLCKECGLSTPASEWQTEPAQLAREAAQRSVPQLAELPPGEIETLRQAKEYLVALIAAEAARQGQPLLDVEIKILFDSEEGWVPDDIKDVRAIFQRFHDQDEYEARIVALLRALAVRVRSKPAELARWKAALALLRRGRDYLMELVAAAEGRKRRVTARAGFWAVLAIVVGLLVIAMVWMNR